MPISISRPMKQSDDLLGGQVRPRDHQLHLLASPHLLLIHQGVEPEGINPDQGSLQVDRLILKSIPGKDNPLTELIESFCINCARLPEHLDLIALPGVVDGNCEVERLVFHPLYLSTLAALLIH